MEYRQIENEGHSITSRRPTDPSGKRRVAITADSTCDLPNDLLERFRIKVIPLTITLGEESFLDDESFEPDRIYQRFLADGILPQTAAPSIQQYTDFFAELRRDGFDVVHLTISSELSSSYANANIAAEGMSGIYVVDSRMLSNGVGLLAVEGAEYSMTGMSAPEIAEKLRVQSKKVQTSFILDTLDYMRKGGRCSSIAAIGANLLHIKPALIMQNGIICVFKKYRGSLERVYAQYLRERLADKKVRPNHIFLAESGGIDRQVVEELAQVIRETVPLKELHITRAGCTVSSHCGPRAIGLFFIGE